VIIETLLTDYFGANERISMIIYIYLMLSPFFIFIAAAAFLSGGCASASAPAGPRNVNLAQDYRYTEEPRICFFPAAQAKWDGYQVTNKDWNKLTNYLKLMFIFEGVKELERNKGVIIKIKDSYRTLLVLNYGLDKINKEAAKSEIPVIVFLYNVLRDAKMVAPRRIGATGR